MITVGELAKRRCSVPANRYYEATGLLPMAQRREDGHRTYRRPDLARLTLIRRCRDFDMLLDKIKDLLELEASGKPCEETLDFFVAQRDAIQARTKALQDLDFTPSLYVAKRHSGCRQNDATRNIYQDLATS